MQKKQSNDLCWKIDFLGGIILLLICVISVHPSLTDTRQSPPALTAALFSCQYPNTVSAIISSVSSAARSYLCHFPTHHILPSTRVSSRYLSTRAPACGDLLQPEWGFSSLRVDSNTAYVNLSPEERNWGMGGWNALCANDGSLSHWLEWVRGWSRALICALLADRLAGALGMHRGIMEGQSQIQWWRTEGLSLLPLRPQQPKLWPVNMLES